MRRERRCECEISDRRPQAAGAAGRSSWPKKNTTRGWCVCVWLCIWVMWGRAPSTPSWSKIRSNNSGILDVYLEVHLNHNHLSIVYLKREVIGRNVTSKSLFRPLHTQHNRWRHVGTAAGILGELSPLNTGGGLQISRCIFSQNCLSRFGRSFDKEHAERSSLCLDLQFGIQFRLVR